jgi:sugar lactone lactonase YvrE
MTLAAAGRRYCVDPQPTTLMTGVAMGESPRWHDGRLWFADWGAQHVVAVDPDGTSEVVFAVPSGAVQHRLAAGRSPAGGVRR